MVFKEMGRDSHKDGLAEKTKGAFLLVPKNIQNL